VADEETTKLEPPQSETPVMAEPTETAAKRGMTLKDWMTILLSSLAFIISAGTAYFNIIRQEDDVRVVIQGELLIRPDELTDKSIRSVKRCCLLLRWRRCWRCVVHPKMPATAVRTDQNLTLINSGNRAVGITLVELLVSTSVLKDLQSCTGDTWVVQLQFTPLVLKGGEITTTTLKLEPFKDEMSEDGYRKLPIPKLFTDEYKVAACLSFNIITPDSVNEKVIIRLLTGVLRRHPLNAPLGSFTVSWSPNPIVLIKRLRTVFW